jgi:hypothetical protein
METVVARLARKIKHALALRAASRVEARSSVVRITVIACGFTLAQGVGVAGAQAPADCRVIEDFSKAKVGEFPGEWKARTDSGKGAYLVQEDGGKRFLHADAKNLGVQAAREYEWDLNAYPVLAWSWRPLEFPRGADEKDGKNDSALAVYMLVPYSRIRGPKAVKYVWSEKVPVGTRLQSNGGLTQVRVLQSGNDKRGQWVEERVNVRDDYVKYFDEKDAPKAAGIAVLTDSDDTQSSAQGDYADLRVCRQ